LLQTRSTGVRRGGVYSLLHFLFKNFGEKLSTVQKEKVIHFIENVFVGSVIAGGIKVGEKGLKLFEEQGFGIVLG
jgi:hypothetical protein